MAIEQEKLNAQCFVKRKIKSVFSGENHPELLYVCRILPDASEHPRIMHSHSDFVEISLIFEGKSQYYIGDSHYDVEKGDLIIYNAGVVHDENSGPDNKVGHFCIAIAGLRMPGLEENQMISKEAGYVFKTEKDFEQMSSLCQMMFEALAEDEARAELFCHGLMRAFLSKVLNVIERNTDVEMEQPLDDYPVLSQQIKEYIDEHFWEQVTLQTIGEALHISPYYIGHVFKKATGYSPMQYVQRRRIGEAQTLLINTELSIVEIAGMLGYDSQSHFNVQFTKQVGMPPKKYRKNYVV